MWLRTILTSRNSIYNLQKEYCRFFHGIVNCSDKQLTDNIWKTVLIPCVIPSVPDFIKIWEQISFYTYLLNFRRWSILNWIKLLFADIVYCYKVWNIQLLLTFSVWMYRIWNTVKPPYSKLKGPKILSLYSSVFFVCRLMTTCIMPCETLCSLCAGLCYENVLVILCVQYFALFWSSREGDGECKYKQ
jgi:hypothetical protein